MTDRRRAIDRLHIGACLVSAALLWLFPADDAACWRGAVSLTLAALPFARRKMFAGASSGLAVFVGAAIPWLSVLHFFTSLPSIEIFWPVGHFDPWLAKWDEALFGFQPGIEWQRILTGVVNDAVGEVLSFFYVTFYAHFTVLALLLLAKRRDADIERLVFVVTATFAGHFLFFSIFPSAGPQFTDPSAGAVQLDPGWVFSRLHFELSSRFDRPVAAFPSSHVAISFVTALFAWRYRVWRVFFAICFVAVFLSVTYLGPHFFVDAPAGTATGALGYWWGNRRIDRIGRDVS